MYHKFLNEKSIKKTKSNTDNDFGLMFGQFLEPKSLQNLFQSGSGRDMNENSVSKLKIVAPENSGAIPPTRRDPPRPPWAWATFLQIFLKN